MPWAALLKQVPCCRIPADAWTHLLRSNSAAEYKPNTHAMACMQRHQNFELTLMRLFASSLTAVYAEPGMQPVAAQVAPVLVPGCDDIFWMHRLHGALSSHGLHCGDEEMEAWVFGDQTQSALLTYQVCVQAMRLSPMTGNCAVIALHRQSMASLHHRHTATRGP